MKKTTMGIFLLMLVWISTAFKCGGSSTPSDPNKGFFVVGQARVYNGFQQRYLLYPTGGHFHGDFLSGAGTYGYAYNFDAYESFANYQARGAKVPGTWRISLSGPSFRTSSLCLGGVTRDVNVSLGSQETLICPGGTTYFGVQPASMDALNAPAVFTITGSGIDSTYGAPMIAFYDEFGNVIASEPASQTFGADGSPLSGPGIESLTVSSANLSQVYDGTYSTTVNNVNADGTWTIIGGASVDVYGNPPPPPPPPDTGGCTQQPKDQVQLPCDATVY